MIHPTADISKKAKIGQNTKIWHEAQVREDAEIGSNCIIGKGVYIDKGVKIGNNVKIQNRASIYHGASIEDGAFIGPHVCLTNDKHPRAITPEGSLKTDDDWVVSKILVKKGASIGAGSVILPGIQIGEFAMIGAGSVVTEDIPGYALAYGNPARLKGFVCKCGNKTSKAGEEGNSVILECIGCKEKIKIKKEIFQKAR